MSFPDLHNDNPDYWELHYNAGGRLNMRVWWVNETGSRCDGVLDIELGSLVVDGAPTPPPPIEYEV